MQSFIGWIGGKRALRKDILAMFPENYSRYIEVFGGAGWVLFGKTYSAGQLEVFNDADGSLINIYRCIKYHPDALAAELSGLPQSREIFFDWQNQICQRGYTDIQRAARSLYLIKESFGSDRRTFATAPRISENITASFSEVQKRLRKVIIENLDFERLIHIYDRHDALFYCDPPYIGTEKYYQEAFSTQDHERLAKVLHEIKGKFLLSYNDCPLARELYKDCTIQSLTRENLLAGAKRGEFKEILIRNYDV